MKKKIGVKVTRIQWDTDGRKVKGLPKEVKVKLERIEECLDLDNATDEDISDVIGEILTQDYEFCHNGFKWTWLTKKMTQAEARWAKIDVKVKALRKHVERMCKRAAANCDAELGTADWDDLEDLAYKLAR